MAVASAEPQQAPAPVADRPPAWRTTISTLLRLGLSVVWLWAGLAKITDIELSQRAVKQYQVFPNEVAEVIGTVLPVLEIALGLLLLVGLFIRPVAILSGLIMVVFIAGLAQAQARGLTLECGCFGEAGEGGVSKYQEILRDIGFLAMACWLAVWPRTYWAADNLLRPPPQQPTEPVAEDAEEALRD